MSKEVCRPVNLFCEVNDIVNLPKQSTYYSSQHMSTLLLTAILTASTGSLMVYFTEQRRVLLEFFARPDGWCDDGRDLGVTRECRLKETTIKGRLDPMLGRMNSCLFGWLVVCLVGWLVGFFWFVYCRLHRWKILRASQFVRAFVRSSL